MWCAVNTSRLGGLCTVLFVGRAARGLSPQPLPSNRHVLGISSFSSGSEALCVLLHHSAAVLTLPLAVVVISACSCGRPVDYGTPVLRSPQHIVVSRR